jgi:hypothetical protein
MAEVIHKKFTSGGRKAMSTGNADTSCRASKEPGRCAATERREPITLVYET